MSIESDVKEIKKALSDNKKALDDLQRGLNDVERATQKMKRSDSDSFFKVVKGTALAAAITKIANIESLLKELKRNG